MAPSSPASEPGRHVVLVGMMGSGKTSVGRQVAERLGRPFLDSDDQVESRTGRSVREIFETDGEAAYRKLESEALAAAVASRQPQVIAAAGGTVTQPANRERLRQAGTVVWLRATPHVLAERVRSGHHRPLLADDPLGTLSRLAEERHDLYREVADHVVDASGGDPAAVADRVVVLAVPAR